MISHTYQLVSPGVFAVKYEDLHFSGNVITRPYYLSICRADQRYFQGRRDAQTLRQKLPMALIHECCGEVVGGEGFPVGQQVVLIPNIPVERDEAIYENYLASSRFLSSGGDGFLREYVGLPADRVVPAGGIDPPVAAIAEFVSVAVHAAARFDRAAHARRGTIGIWGDGSLAYTLACVLVRMFPESRIAVVGRNARKLSLFSFVSSAYLADSLPKGFAVDHAFECAGGEGSYYAIEDIIRCIRPQGSVLLMGVSENRVAVNTRLVLEKGLTFVGCSRSGRVDFETAVGLMRDTLFQRRLRMIITEAGTVSGIQDLYRVFALDVATPFKTVFRWRV